MSEVRINLQPKQKQFRQAVRDYPVVFFGGSKGGGKSYGLRNLLLILASENPKSKGLLVRKTYDELLSNHIEQFFRENPDLFQYYNKGDKILSLPNGSTIRFRHLQHKNDVYNYQGQEFDFIGIDELTQHDKDIFTILRSSNRTTNPKIKPRMLLTGNPGGIGHSWVRKLFIVKDYESNERPEDYFFVPAKVYDNAELVDNDPDYIQRLEALPEDLRRAYLDGDWDVFQGQFFREWDRNIHIVEPFEIYPQWDRMIGVDYGYNKPSSVHWYAVDYSGRLICYRELYETELTFTELGKKIAEMTPQEEFMKNGKLYNERENIKYLVFDPSIKIRSNESGVSGEELLRQGLHKRGLKTAMIPANNNRKYGWTVMREFMRTRPDGYGGTTAGIVWFNTCFNAIRTIPEMIYSAIKLEDMDTDGDDHVSDETRYLCVSVRTKPSNSHKKIKQVDSFAKRAFYDKLKKLRNKKKQGYNYI